MITPIHLIIAITMACAATLANAQFVKGNEAVQISPNGQKQVFTAPLPKTGPIHNIKSCNADANCHAGAWRMVETEAGLKECTEAYGRPGTCRTSTYGTKKLSRVWVVKSGKNWLQCQYPDMSSKCVDMFSRPPTNLPFDAVQ